jgi:molybdate transport system regulatory protein
VDGTGRRAAKWRSGMHLTGTVVLRKGGADYLGGSRVALLEEIHEHGSIAKAARAAEVSYKTAWETVNAVNNLADRPLVRAATGGRGGGGTVLTEEGKAVVRTYRLIEREHARFLASLGESLGDADRTYALLRRIAMKISARNVFAGRIVSVATGAVNAEAVLALSGGERITAVVTNESARRLGLSEGLEALAIVKASSILVGKYAGGVRLSARNVLPGKVARVATGAVNVDVTLSLDGGNTIAAVITRESAKALDLKEGDDAFAAFKASSVVLGVD